MDGTPMTCKLCGERLPPSGTVRGRDRFYDLDLDVQVVRCGACGGGTTIPEVPGAELGALYPAAYGPHVGPPQRGALALVSRAVRRLQARNALRGAPLRPVVALPPGRALEVGGGRGDRAALLIRRGWQVTGVEPSPEACEAARAHGVDARVGTLEDVELEPEAYDAAVFEHSLEHTADPQGDLERTAAALRPGAVLSIAIPNYGNWQARAFRGRWFHLDLPRHRFHFTEPALRGLVERAGFEVQSIRTTTSAAGLPASVQYAIAGRCLFPSGLRWRIAAGLAALLWPVARVLDRVLGGGDTLHAVARRR